MKPLLLSLGLLALATPALAENWQIVDRSTQQGDMSIDLDSLQVSGDRRFIDVKFGAGLDAPEELWTLVKTGVDCRGRLMSMGDMAIHYKDGTVEAEKFEIDANWRAVVPGTPSEIIFNQVCRAYGV